jgi:drug/metabolite transporter (DMT)-like permease
LGEQFHLYHAIGIALIAGGIVLASVRPRTA